MKKLKNCRGCDQLAKERSSVITECSNLMADLDTAQTCITEREEEYDDLQEEMATEIQGLRNTIAQLEADVMEVGSWFRQQQKVSLERYHRIKALEAENAALVSLVNRSVALWD